MNAFKNIRLQIIIKQEGDENEVEWKKGHDIIYYMANIKQDELWVDLLFDGTTIFYLALAESKRFRLGHIRNGKISYQLYPKRKDFVSLNVAIKNLAALQRLQIQSAFLYFVFIAYFGVLDILEFGIF